MRKLPALGILLLVALFLYWVFRPTKSNTNAPPTKSFVAPAAKASATVQIVDLMATMDPMRRLRTFMAPTTPYRKLLMPPSYSARTYREAVDRLASDASPESAIVALQWTFYCFGMSMFRDAPNVPSLYRCHWCIPRE